MKLIGDKRTHWIEIRDTLQSLQEAARLMEEAKE